MRDKLPQPGENEKGERYNNLPIDYNDGGLEEGKEELEEEFETEYLVDRLPNGVSAMDTFNRKHGGGK